MAGTPEKDAISGQSTTGHEWDGIRELNTPLPKWWVYVFYVCIVWAVGYWVVYPAWPTADGFTKGMNGYSSRMEFEVEMAAAKQEHAAELSAIAAKSVDQIAEDKTLMQYAMKGGEVLFKENCAPCHQSGGAGALGYPTLADDEWIWGGTLADIETTLIHGVRSDLSDETRLSEMPAFEGILSDAELTQVAEYVVAMAGGKVAEGPGQQLYLDNCAACHSSDGMNPVSDGGQMLGAPALANQIWMYAGPGGQLGVDGVVAQMKAPKHGVMPAWGGRLSTDTDIKMLTVYVHSLGGGQ